MDEEDSQVTVGSSDASLGQCGRLGSVSSLHLRAGAGAPRAGPSERGATGHISTVSSLDHGVSGVWVLEGPVLHPADRAPGPWRATTHPGPPQSSDPGPLLSAALLYSS